MRLTLLFIVLGILTTSAKSFSQQANFNLNYRSTTIKQILKELHESSGYDFVYSNDDFDTGKKIDLVLTNGTVNEMMDILLKETGMGYNLVDDVIIIAPKTMTNFSRVGDQKQTVSGKVTDSSSAPLPGVSVVIKGTTNGTITDFDGKYTLANVPDNATLVFSFVGMKSQEITIGDQSMINVVLHEETIGIEEVVAVGYGVQKKVNLTGSVSSISYGENLENRPITHLSQAISGNASGILVAQNSGQPGSDGATIRIRGVGTLNNSDPLVIIDGDISSMNNVNPEDVASISILKDAASAAIYGSRAANGVIVVTTKKGKSGKTVINYNGSYGVQEATHLFKPVTDYATYMELMNRINKADNASAPNLFSQSTIDTWRNATDREAYPNNDWMQIIFGKGSMKKHSLSMSGGNEKTTFYVSGSYMHNKGIMENTEYKYYSTRINLDHQISNKIKIGANISADWRDTEEPIDPVTLMYYGANSVPGQTPKKIVDGEVRYGGGNSSEESSSVANPLQYLNTWFYPQVGKYYRSKIYAEINLLKNLKWLVNGNIEYYNKQSKQYKLSGPVQWRWNFNTGAVTSKNDDQPSTLTQSSSEQFISSLYSTLNYAKKFNNHDVNVLLGVSRETQDNSNFSARNQKFPSNDTWELNAGLLSPIVSGNSSGFRLESYFGRLNYNYNEKYLLEANFRYDGSSRFAPDNRWGLFPSFSAAWALSKEQFFNKLNLSVINSMKFRASWGQLGNQQIDLYQYMDLYSPGQDYTIGGNLSAGLAPTTLSNPGITWETTTTSDIGADVSLFKSKLNITVDWYNRKTEDILVRMPLSSLYGGLTAPYQNVGIVENKGWEIELQHKNKIGEIGYSISGNLTTVDNEVVFLQGDPKVTQSLGNNTYIMQGQPYGVIYGYRSMGTFKNAEEIAAWATQKTNKANKPGDLKYEDVSGPDGVPDGIINASDRVILGSNIPDFYYGLNASVDYRGFNLYLLFQGIYGAKRYYSNLWNTTAIRYGREINSYFLDSWSAENPDSDIPRLTLDTNGDNTQVSSFWVQDVSYLRLKDVQLSYTFPAKWLKSTFISRLQVYGNAQNVFTWTKFRGLDPETANYTQYQVEYPNVRIISFGINASF
ncbi:MAG: TonB-dependent receptor [Prolixibacteraceae bacterium]|nr:TonB-dependent receptor [Prolixibacteraceae bacterium]